MSCLIKCWLSVVIGELNELPDTTCAAAAAAAERSFLTCNCLFYRTSVSVIKRQVSEHVCLISWFAAILSRSLDVFRLYMHDKHVSPFVGDSRTIALYKMHSSDVLWLIAQKVALKQQKKNSHIWLYSFVIALQHCFRSNSTLLNGFFDDDVRRVASLFTVIIIQPCPVCSEVA